jgi:hypothetical protein
MPSKLRDPIFVFDSEEKFLPMAVESAEAAPATLVVGGEDTGVAVSLAALPKDGGRMNFGPDSEAQEKRLRPKFGKVGYRRQLDDGGLTWVQYWLWYLYNPKAYLGVGKHEGDWEFVQVGYAGETPVCMTTSRHHTGGSRMWWEIELYRGRPKIYVAVDSHANFFTPRQGVTEIEDTCDGKGEKLSRIKWKEFGPWQDWPGLWGNSTEEGRSPESPGRQEPRWSHPALYHTQSRDSH